MNTSHHNLYRLDYSQSFWKKIRYTISRNNALVAPIYRAPRTGFHRSRPFEDANNNMFFRIDKCTIRSVGNNRVLASVNPHGMMVQTYLGNLNLTDLNTRRRSYTLSNSNGDVLMRVKRQLNVQCDRHLIEMNATVEEDQPFLFALAIFIDSILRRNIYHRTH